MRPLGRGLVVFAVRMTLVVVVFVSTLLAVMLTITVCLGFNVAAVTVAVIFGCLGCFAAENGAAQYNARRNDHGDGDQMLLADVQFVGIDFHVYSLFAGWVAFAPDSPSTRSMSAAVRCASANALRY